MNRICMVTAVVSAMIGHISFLFLSVLCTFAGCGDRDVVSGMIRDLSIPSSADFSCV